MPYNPAPIPPSVPPIDHAPGMSVNPGVTRFFNRLVWLSRLTGGRLSSGDAVDRSGFNGAVNLVFAPSADGTWHCLLSENRFRFAKGRHENAIGTVTLESDTFLRMLAGLTTYSTAEMTGKIRVEGEGHSTFVVSSIILQTRTQARETGPMGWIARSLIKSTLKKSATGYEMDLS